MHSQNISTKKPGLVLFLIDQSSSMLHGWGGDRDASKSQLAADALNKTLYDLALNACMKDGRPVDRVHIGAYYYSTPRQDGPSTPSPKAKGGPLLRTGFQGTTTLTRFLSQATETKS
ncbi:uncharacterized protein METZ01_LOCUS442344 [marine metagenome]|uniref:VWFA domain-containing protein n=1 Tax=marine metagenome TaxID=408172 RepID=A0A382Z2F6_9ZZZZ